MPPTARQNKKIVFISGPPEQKYTDNFVQSFVSKIPRNKQHPTFGLEVYPLDINETTRFNIWNCGFQWREEYLFDADCIVFLNGKGIEIPSIYNYRTIQVDEFTDNIFDMIHTYLTI